MLTVSSHILHESFQSEDAIDKLQESYITAVPYNHVVISSLCSEDVMKAVQKEAKENLKANYKETDLFKVFQSGELALADTTDNATGMKNLIALRNAVYSPEFRRIVSKITGVNDLIERVDCSANAYTNSCHLLCHDDVIGTRRVSYVIYLTDPDDPWIDADGGALELFPVVPPIESESENAVAVPSALPSASILPLFNTMMLFAVQPGVSYHAVQEVFATGKPRLSIRFQVTTTVRIGWYHGPSPLLDSSKSSLSQILRAPSFQSAHGDGDAFLPIEGTDGQDGPEPDEDEKLSASETKKLKKYLNPAYLKKAYMEDVNKQFCDSSSLLLNDFLRRDVAEAITKGCVLADNTEKIGGRRPQLDHTVGISPLSTDGWRLVGPPHKQRYLRFESETNSSVPPVNSEKSENIVIPPRDNGGASGSGMEVGERLRSILTDLFCSKEFVKYLRIVTSLRPTGVKGEVRRFRAGLDYTVAHYGILTKVPRLDATLCFVCDDKEIESAVLSVPSAAEEEGPLAAAGKKTKKSPSTESQGSKRPKKETSQEEEDEEDEEDEEEDEEDDYGVLWDSGDVGGFECFIEVDQDAENAEAAEVYRAPGALRRKREDGKADEDGVEGDEDEDGEDSKLLSVSAGCNVLSLVMRDEGIMKFVKYVSANAPGSRWDVAMEYQIVVDDSEDVDEEVDEDEDEGDR